MAKTILEDKIPFIKEICEIINDFDPDFVWDEECFDITAWQIDLLRKLFSFLHSKTFSSPLENKQYNLPEISSAIDKLLDMIDSTDDHNWQINLLYQIAIPFTFSPPPTNTNNEGYNFIRVNLKKLAELISYDRLSNCVLSHYGKNPESVSTSIFTLQPTEHPQVKKRVLADENTNCSAITVADIGILFLTQRYDLFLKMIDAIISNQDAINYRTQLKVVVDARTSYKSLLEFPWNDIPWHDIFEKSKKDIVQVRLLLALCALKLDPQDEIASDTITSFSQALTSSRRPNDTLHRIFCVPENFLLTKYIKILIETKRCDLIAPMISKLFKVFDESTFIKAIYEELKNVPELKLPWDKHIFNEGKEGVLQARLLLFLCDHEKKITDDEIGFLIRNLPDNNRLYNMLCNSESFLSACISAYISACIKILITTNRYNLIAKIMLAITNNKKGSNDNKESSNEHTFDLITKIKLLLAQEGLIHIGSMKKLLHINSNDPVPYNIAKIAIPGLHFQMPRDVIDNFPGPEGNWPIISFFYALSRAKNITNTPKQLRKDGVDFLKNGKFKNINGYINIKGKKPAEEQVKEYIENFLDELEISFNKQQTTDSRFEIEAAREMLAPRPVIIIECDLGKKGEYYYNIPKNIKELTGEPIFLVSFKFNAECFFCHAAVKPGFDAHEILQQLFSDMEPQEQKRATSIIDDRKIKSDECFDIKSYDRDNNDRDGRDEFIRAAIDYYEETTEDMAINLKKIIEKKPSFSSDKDRVALLLIFRDCRNNTILPKLFNNSALTLEDLSILPKKTFDFFNADDGKVPIIGNNDYENWHLTALQSLFWRDPTDVHLINNLLLRSIHEDMALTYQLLKNQNIIEQGVLFNPLVPESTRVILFMLIALHRDESQATKKLYNQLKRELWVVSFYDQVKLRTCNVTNKLGLPKELEIKIYDYLDDKYKISNNNEPPIKTLFTLLETTSNNPRDELHPLLKMFVEQCVVGTLLDNNIVHSTMVLLKNKLKLKDISDEFKENLKKSLRQVFSECHIVVYDMSLCTKEEKSLNPALIRRWLFGALLKNWSSIEKDPCVENILKYIKPIFANDNQVDTNKSSNVNKQSSSNAILIGNNGKTCRSEEEVRESEEHCRGGDSAYNNFNLFNASNKEKGGGYQENKKTIELNKQSNNFSLGFDNEKKRKSKEPTEKPRKPKKQRRDDNNNAGNKEKEDENQGNKKFTALNRK